MKRKGDIENENEVKKEFMKHEENCQAYLCAVS